MTRTELERFLQDTLQYGEFEDYCRNGLQVEGKDNIEKITFGVSFNSLLMEESLAQGADAIVVHHGIFGREFFSVRGLLKKKVKRLLEEDVSLFGIHLPLDAHPRYGNNAQLMEFIGAEIIEPLDVGFIGRNRAGHTMHEMLEVFHGRLGSFGPGNGAVDSPDGESDPSPAPLVPRKKHGFTYLDHGPEQPAMVAIVSGGASRHYEAALERGVDTFICGEIKEPVPAISHESSTNFVSIGHYWSEKPGILALEQAVRKAFDVETRFVDIPNSV